MMEFILKMMDVILTRAVLQMQLPEMDLAQLGVGQGLGPLRRCQRRWRG